MSKLKKTNQYEKITEQELKELKTSLQKKKKRAAGTNGRGIGRELKAT